MLHSDVLSRSCKLQNSRVRARIGRWGWGEGGREGRITPRLDSLKIPFFGLTPDRLKKG